MTRPQPPLVSWFSDIELAHRALVGGKGASLGELTRAGFSTPPGFVVTTRAFEDFLAASSATGTIRARIALASADDLQALGRLSQDIRRGIEQAALPAALVAEVRVAWEQLCSGDSALPVAVRSSATGEDSADASFAGLQETHLWVQGWPAVERALRACWASLYSVEAVSYRRHRLLPEEHMAMGVVIQRMVSARAAGVMFTRSPTSGDRSVIAIEGSWGLGSCIVSGEVTPDKFVVSKVTGEILHRTVSCKNVRHVPDPDRSGVRSEPVPEEAQRIACLSDGELRELVRIAKQLEHHYGSAQDIEWAVADEAAAGAIYLLQSRPETIWARRERKPAAAPSTNAFDHVIAALGGRKD
ncbi:MAG TPA: PEP/pyruvate-binding domain-containing protein [Steroidobacteraceae bacterium]|nr:PEP/pyruvate-binding domain-containing protein [Steroidobacteraceae bacterium]